MATHRLAPGSQQPPAQAAPAQHGCPGPPQAVHRLLSQVRVWLLHAVAAGPPQQGWPGPPHCEHEPLKQRVALAVQKVAPPVPTQQGWPGPPQLLAVIMHDPAVQVPPTTGQELPAMVHTLDTQQPPPPHELAAQQASPVPPQRVHTPAPAPVHTLAASQARPAQQV